MERRNMLGRGLMAGVAGLFVTPPAAAAGEAVAAAAEDTSEAAARSIDRLRSMLDAQMRPASSSAYVGAIRQQQRTFLRANQKYPDYIEVGLGVWEDVYDWHVRHQQPINATRLADGRYVMAFMFTNLVLRPDQSPEFVGFGFDNDPVRRGNP